MDIPSSSSTADGYHKALDTSMQAIMTRTDHGPADAVALENPGPIPIMSSDQWNPVAADSFDPSIPVSKEDGPGPSVLLSNDAVNSVSDA